MKKYHEFNRQHRAHFEPDFLLIMSKFSFGLPLLAWIWPGCGFCVTLHNIGNSNSIVWDSGV